MTFSERGAALGFLGLTPRQAAFVAAVALTGGYCLRRQYAAFAGLVEGAVVRAFLDGLAARGFMSRFEYRHTRGFTYHLHAKRIFRALGEPHNRNSRLVPPAFVARKLMLLDVVIAERDRVWLCTENDKVHYFSERLGIPKSDLPQKAYTSAKGTGNARPATTRYFLNRSPIYLDARESGHVHFIALALDSSGGAFGRFLSEHQRLLAGVPEWTVHAVRPAGLSSLEASRAVFERAKRRGATADASASVTNPDWLRYFETRFAIAETGAGTVSIEDLNAYRVSRTCLLGPLVEEAYRLWATERKAALGPAERRPPVLPSQGSFVGHELPFSYRRFGDFAGEA